jgi:hypothetical protein
MMLVWTKEMKISEGEWDGDGEGLPRRFPTLCNNEEPKPKAHIESAG